MSEPDWREQFRKRYGLAPEEDPVRFIDDWEAKYGFQFPEMGQA